MAFTSSSSSFLLEVTKYLLLQSEVSGITDQGDYKDESADAGILVKIYPKWYKEVSLSWEVPVNSEYDSFNVYSSYSKSGPFRKLNSQPLESTSFVDRTSQEYSKYHEGQYFIEAFSSSNPAATRRSRITSWQNNQSRWVELRSFDIQRREYFLLTHFTGVKSWLFRKKAFGQRCPRCFNTSTQAVMDDNCSICLGTSFIDGYYLHSEFWAQYEPTPNDRINTYFGKYEPNQIGAWTISFPEITDNDVIVRYGDLNVYKVDKVSATELQAIPVRQMLIMSQLARKDIENLLIQRIPNAI